MSMNFVRKAVTSNDSPPLDRAFASAYSKPVEIIKNAGAAMKKRTLYASILRVAA